MAGPRAGHLFFGIPLFLDGRVEPGHDDGGSPRSKAPTFQEAPKDWLVKMAVYSEIAITKLTAADLDFLELRDGADGLQISLSNFDQLRAKLTFYGYLCYRTRDEGDALKTLAEFRAQIEDGPAALIYEVSASEFVKWFDEENFGARSHQGAKHYCVFTTNYIIDVISLHEPNFELIP